MNVRLEPTGEGSYRVMVRASGERRQVEALALELRRQIKELGVTGVTVNVSPAGDACDHLPPATRG